MSFKLCNKPLAQCQALERVSRVLFSGRDDEFLSKRRLLLNASSSIPGFGFSDKPQPGPGFSYGLDEYQKALGSFLDALSLEKVTIVAQVRLRLIAWLNFSDR